MSVQSLEYSTLRNLSITMENLGTLLKDQQRLINLFWHSQLPKKNHRGHHYEIRMGKEVGMHLFCCACVKLIHWSRAGIAQSVERLPCLTLWGSITHNKSQTQAPLMLAGKYVDENSSAAIVGAKRSAGVAPEANLRILLCAFNKACKKGDPLWLWNPGQISLGVQNRGICGPTKRTWCPPKMFFKKLIHWKVRRKI